MATLVSSPAAYTLGALTLVNGALLYYTNQNVPQPYMDEIFHVPQTIEYCNQNFHKWDPMITTFPGLYLLFLAYQYVLGLIQWVLPFFPWTGVMCDVTMMRSLNTCLGLLNFVVFYKIHETLFPHLSKTQHTIRALLLHLFPLQFFFHFLYYTDIASTFFVMLCYLLGLKDRPVASALVGVLAVCCRQTNVVWVTFVAATIVLRRFEAEQQGTTQDQPNFVSSLWNFTCYVFRNLFKITSEIWAFFLIAGGFLAFAFMNGGIVIGDRTNHQPCIHVAQLLYFLGFAAVWLSPEILWYIYNHRADFTRNYLTRQLKWASFALLLGIGAVYRFTLVHRYTLADNRHYIYYFWRWFLGKHFLQKYLYIPFYLIGFWAFVKLLAQNNRSALWQLLFFACVSLTVVPAHLIEFRYFIIPFLMLQLHIWPHPLRQPGDNKPIGKDAKDPTATVLWAEGALFVLVDALTCAVFIWLPFKGGDGNTAHWIW